MPVPNLKQRIVELLKDFPARQAATPGQPFDSYLEDLADDIQAETIKELNRLTGNQQNYPPLQAPRAA